jgi:hypothetical protein
MHNVSFDDPKAYPGAWATVAAGWPPFDADSLAHSPTCRPSSARVTLATRGLAGGVASLLETGTTVSSLERSSFA